jgi:predicted SAM-dependent methyltransferase
MSNKILRNMLRVAVPADVRRSLRQIQKSVVYFSRRQSIRIPVAAGRAIKIIVGAAMTHQKGWYSTNEQWLDITCEAHWQEVFKGKPLLSHVLAEHVFEHLTPDETRRALVLVASHMRIGGCIRIAVPDGYHPDPEYLRHVGVAGIGADASDHKQLLNSDSLMTYLYEAGFAPVLKEGYRRDGTLVQQPLDMKSGIVIRSRSNAKTMSGRAGWDFVDANTSLVVDATLPA